jgi:hypothetical protein
VTFPENQTDNPQALRATPFVKGDAANFTSRYGTWP